MKEIGFSLEYQKSVAGVERETTVHLVPLLAFFFDVSNSSLLWFFSSDINRLNDFFLTNEIC